MRVFHRVHHRVRAITRDDFLESSIFFDTVDQAKKNANGSALSVFCPIDGIPLSSHQLSPNKYSTHGKV
jgi:hypothetical protein